VVLQKSKFDLVISNKYVGLGLGDLAFEGDYDSYRFSMDASRNLEVEGAIVISGRVSTLRRLSPIEAAHDRGMESH